MQTGSGKTFTMFGPNVSEPEHCGLIPRAINDLFQQVITAPAATARGRRGRATRAHALAHTGACRKNGGRDRAVRHLVLIPRDLQGGTAARPVRPAECRCGGGCIVHTMCNAYLPVHGVSRAASAAQWCVTSHVVCCNGRCLRCPGVSVVCQVSSLCQVVRDLLNTANTNLKIHETGDRGVWYAAHPWRPLCH